MLLQVPKLLLLDHFVHLDLEGSLFLFDSCLELFRSLFDLALADGWGGGHSRQRRLVAEALAKLTLLSLKFDNPSQEVEVTGPGRNLFAVQVLLGYDHLLFEKLFVDPFFLSPAVRKKSVRSCWNYLLFLAKHSLVVSVAGLGLLENCLRFLFKLLHELPVLRQDRGLSLAFLLFNGRFLFELRILTYFCRLLAFWLTCWCVQGLFFIKLGPFI